MLHNYLAYGHVDEKDVCNIPFRSRPLVKNQINIIGDISGISACLRNNRKIVLKCNSLALICRYPYTDK